jgi:hypothetical protein
VVAVDAVVDDTDREAAFRADVAAMKVRGGVVARERVLARVGAVLLLAGILVGVYAYSQSHATTDPLEQRDAIILGSIGVSVSIAGLALFLRYSLGALLRLWLARLVLDREPGDS